MRVTYATSWRLVFLEDAADMVVSSDAEVLTIDDAVRQWAGRGGLAEEA